MQKLFYVAKMGGGPIRILKLLEIKMKRKMLWRGKPFLEPPFIQNLDLPLNDSPILQCHEWSYNYATISLTLFILVAWYVNDLY